MPAPEVSPTFAKQANGGDLCGIVGFTRTGRVLNSSYIRQHPKVDHMSMAHSLEVRPPFLDHRICEFALSLPEELKIRRSRLKFVLRELMATKLPRSILNRKKVGFDIPAHAWLLGALKHLLPDTLTKDAVEESGFFWLPGIESLLKEHLERRRNWGYHLWGLTIPLLWARKWKMGVGSWSSSSPPPSFLVASTALHI